MVVHQQWWTEMHKSGLQPSSCARLVDRGLDTFFHLVFLEFSIALFFACQSSMHASQTEAAQPSCCAAHRRATTSEYKTTQAMLSN